MQHTPGPWHFTRRTDDNARLLKTEQGTGLMCDVEFYPWIDLNDADWRLVAAAPELLRVLKIVNDYMSNSPYATDCGYEHAQVQAAIELAERHDVDGGQGK